jgi:hypothetical protein
MRTKQFVSESHDAMGGGPNTSGSRSKLKIDVDVSHEFKNILE